MAINFMPELDQTGVLERLLDNPKHIARMSDVNPHTDYSNWADKLTVVKLLNVKWDARNHVVNWKDEDSRDAFFDAQNEGTITYSTNWNQLDLENFSPSLGTYEGNIKVPVPLEQALGYNYIMIDRYQQPVKSEENAPVRSRFFFFITGVNKSPRSPDLTDLIIELDAWTEYTFEGFEGMAGDLERGHYPIDKITTEEYLSNPLDSPVNLFEPEPTLPELKTKVSYEHFTSPYNDPVFIVGSTMDFMNDTGYIDNQKHTPDEEYWWLDYTNDKYTNKYTDDSNLDLDYLASVDPQYKDDGTKYDVDDGKPLGRATRKSINDNDQNVTSIFYYILEPAQWENFIITLRRYYPQIYDTLTAVFILPRNYVLQGTKFISTFGIDMQYAHQNNQLTEEYKLTLSPDMFGWKQDFTKLYTEQFSELEISNLDGQRAKLQIEDTTGTLQFLFRANLMYPFLKFEGFLNGKGGGQINHYNLAPLHPQDYQLFESNWEDLHFEWDIPTYGIYEDAKTYSFQLGQKLQRDWALAHLEYRNTLADIDKMHANTFNDIETSFKTGTNSANTARDNANASNDTALTNALASANTAKDNAQESATNTKTTADESAETAKDTSLNTISNTQKTADESNDTSKETGLNSINTAYDVSQRNATNGADNADADIQNLQDQWGVENSKILRTSDIAGAMTALGAASSIYVSVQKGEIFTSPTGGGGDAIGAINKAGVLGLSLAEIGAQTANDTNALGNSKDFNVKKATKIKDNNYTTASTNNSQQQSNDTTNTNLNWSTTKQINQQNADTNNANTMLIYNNAMNINNQNYTTAVDNLLRTYNTAVANANRSHDTTASNIARTYNTTTANLNLELNKGLKNLDNEVKTDKNNALINLNKKKTEMDLTLATTLSSTPRAVTQNQGNGSIDAWGRRGIDIRINRISKADEDVVINEFKRFGYQMPSNTWIQSPTFDPISSSYGQRHYSYWKFREIYSWSTKMSQTARSVIISILHDGVTIWDDPNIVQESPLQ